MHKHRCMRCNEEFDCQTPGICKAQYDVLPTIFSYGPHGEIVSEEHRPPLAPNAPTDTKSALSEKEISAAIGRVDQYFDHQCTAHHDCPVPHKSWDIVAAALLAARREVEAAQRQLSEPIGADVLLANFVEEWGETQVPKERFDIAQSLFWKAKKYFAPDERDAATPEEK